jgi:hypothetical protein
MLRETKIKSGLNLYDYANIVYGGFDNIVTLIQLNPVLESMDVDLGDFATKPLVYDDKYYSQKTIQIQLTAIKPTSSIKTITGRKGQNLYDLSLLAYSGFDNFVKFCIDNGINSTNDHDVSFKNFKFDTNLNNDLTLQTVINKKGYVFATGVASNITGNLLQEDGFYLLQENGFKILF